MEKIPETVHTMRLTLTLPVCLSTPDGDTKMPEPMMLPTMTVTPLMSVIFGLRVISSSFLGSSSMAAAGGRWLAGWLVLGEHVVWLNAVWRRRFAFAPCVLRGKDSARTGRRVLAGCCGSISRTRSLFAPYTVTWWMTGVGVSFIVGRHLSRPCHPYARFHGQTGYYPFDDFRRYRIKRMRRVLFVNRNSISKVARKYLICRLNMR